LHEYSALNKAYLSQNNKSNTEDFGLIEVGWLNVLLLKFREKNFFKKRFKVGACVNHQ